MLLDSGQADHVDSRFDIIAFDPVATLTTVGEETTIDHLVRRQQQQSQDDPFSLLQQALAEYFPDADDYPLPFSGGALGYFSYDLGRRFEQLPSRAERDIDLPEMAVGLYAHALVRDNLQHRLVLISRSSETQHQDKLAEVKQLIEAAACRRPGAFERTGPWQHQLSEAEYTERFDRVQEYLKSGDCYQINLTQRFQAGYRGDEYQAYLALCESNKTPFSAFLRLPDAAILSISPERFISLEGEAIQTKPIKGTRPRAEDPAQDQAFAEELVNAEKDRAENLMIVDLLRNDIGRVAAPGSVQVPELFAIESFPAVHHLVSTITAQLASGLHATDLLRASFPGGSITGAPKIRAMEIIDELEPHRRSIYCGSIGYISADGKMDTSITIRTLLCQGQQVYCWAGGGVVADSKAAAEYQECFDKVSKILPVL